MSTDNFIFSRQKKSCSSVVCCSLSRSDSCPSILTSSCHRVRVRDRDRDRVKNDPVHNCSDRGSNPPTKYELFENGFHQSHQLTTNIPAARLIEESDVKVLGKIWFATFKNIWQFGLEKPSM